MDAEIAELLSLQVDRCIDDQRTGQEMVSPRSQQDAEEEKRTYGNEWYKGFNCATSVLQENDIQIK